MLFLWICIPPSAVITHTHPAKLSDIGVCVSLSLSPAVKCFYNFFQALTGFSCLWTGELLWLSSPLSILFRRGLFVDVWCRACFADCSHRHLSKSSLCSDGGDVMSCLPKHLGNPGVYVRVCLDEAFHRRRACPSHLGQLSLCKPWLMVAMGGHADF